MTVRVEYGIPASPGLISLALAAGRQPARPSGIIGGGAGGGAGRGAGGGMDPIGDQAASEAFYGRQAQEQAYQQEVDMLQEQARVSAELFEYKYSAKQKQELAQINNAERLLAGPGFSDEDRAQFEPMVRARKLGLKPEAAFRDPDKPVYPEGVGPGILTVEPDGSTTTIDENGNKKLILRPDQTEGYRAKAAEDAYRLEQLKQQIKWEEERRKYEIQWGTEDFQPTQEAKVVKWGKDIKAGPSGPLRKRTPDEVKELLDRFFPRPQPEPTQEDLEVELQRRVDLRKPWWEKLAGRGGEVTEEMKQAPPAVGQAMFSVQEAERKYKGKKIPSGVLAELEMAYGIIEQYRQGGEG